MQLLKNAWDGWLSVTEAGRLTALLLAIIIFFCFTKNHVKRHLLFVYGAVVTVLCIFPVSAALLMQYQTRFYDYQWIWTYVPVTAMIAFGSTVFLCDFWENCKRGRMQKAIVTVALFVVLVMCGRMGGETYKAESVTKPRQDVEQLLEDISEKREGDICLLAPEEVLTYARGIRGDIQLYYGRNMWDKSLNAYSYDNMYPREKEICHQWMLYAQEWGGLKNSIEFDGEKVHLDGVECIRTAVGQGVNVICLPGKMTEEALHAFESELEMTFEKYGEWLIWIAQKIN
ncbi:MAG: hypothetical protein E7287_08320 [Lachnospiraceae bacterium]|nr:hypothetical protein [Lachnospiraceae bacterium]